MSKKISLEDQAAKAEFEYAYRMAATMIADLVGFDNIPEYMLEDLYAQVGVALRERDAQRIEYLKEMDDETTSNI